MQWRFYSFSALHQNLSLHSLPRSVLSPPLICRANKVDRMLIALYRNTRSGVFRGFHGGIQSSWSVDSKGRCDNRSSHGPQLWFLLLLSLLLLLLMLLMLILLLQSMWLLLLLLLRLLYDFWNLIAGNFRRGQILSAPRLIEKKNIGRTHKWTRRTPIRRSPCVYIGSQSSPR